MLRLFDPAHPVSLTIRAEEALGQQEWGVAFDLSNCALKKRADFAPAYFVRGVARLNLDDYQGALHDLNRFLAHTEEPPSLAYYWRGWIYVHREEWALALADFERVLPEAPEDPQLHYWRAYIFWQREEWERLRSALEQLERLVPGHPLVQELHGHLLMHDGAFEQAEQAYTRAIRGGIQNPDLRYKRAVARRELARHDEAREDVEAIFGLEPDNMWAQLELGNFAFAAGRYDEALQHTRAAIALDRTFFEARVNEAATLMAMARAGEARLLLEEMQQEFPEEPLVHQLYGDLLAEEQESEAAVERYRSSLESDPGNHTVRVKLASELLALGRYDEAQKEIDRVLDEDPENLDAYATRSDLARYTNRPDAMRADLDYLLERDPNHAWALAFRAAHRQWCGDLEGALEDYSAALAADGSQAWIWAFRGQYHLRFGRIEAARNDFQRAITLAPEDSWIRRQWSDLLYRTGQFDLAAEVLDCLINEHPDDGYARLFRAELHLEAGNWEGAQRELSAIVADEHELNWLAHGALAALVDGESRQHHLALADEQRPGPTFWGASAATVLAQQALVAWLRGEEKMAGALLEEATTQLEPGERLWLALRPLLTRLGAGTLLRRVEEYEGQGVGREG